MKRYFYNLMCVLLLACCLVGCDDIQSVKQGVLTFDKSTSIGKAFDNYSYFTKKSWKSFETKQGTKIVEFEGNFNLSNYFSNYENLRTILMLEHNKIKVDENKITKDQKNEIMADLLKITREQNSIESLDLGEELILKIFSKFKDGENVFYKQIYKQFENDAFRKTDCRLIVQFKMNKDDTFEISYMGVKINGKDYKCRDLNDVANIYNDKKMGSFVACVYLVLLGIA